MPICQKKARQHDYDNSRALAAFNAKQYRMANELVTPPQQCRSRTGPQDSGVYPAISAIREAARKHYDAAEKLNIPDYQEKEDAFMQLVPACGWGRHYAPVPGEVCRARITLVQNSEKARRYWRWMGSPRRLN